MADTTDINFTLTHKTIYIYRSRLFRNTFSEEIQNDRRNQGIHKTYETIFTCFSARVIPMDLSGGLSTDEFILALHRFIARQRHFKKNQSDNKTNLLELKDKTEW